MDLSKPGPLYDAIRNRLGLNDALANHGRRLRELETSAHDHPTEIDKDEWTLRLEVLEGTVKGLEHRTNHQTVEDRLNAMEERLEKMPKPRSRAKPAEKPATKPATKAKPKPS